MSGAVVRDGARILLVEDDELNRALVRAIVSRCAEPELRGAQLVEAGDLAQARAAIEDAPVDVMLLDMGLPDGSGLDLAAELRDSPRGRAPAIVAVTGNSARSEEHTSELQSRPHLVCRLLLEKKKKNKKTYIIYKKNTKYTT